MFNEFFPVDAFGGLKRIDDGLVKILLVHARGQVSQTSVLDYVWYSTGRCADGDDAY